MGVENLPVGVDGEIYFGVPIGGDTLISVHDKAELETVLAKVTFEDGVPTDFAYLLSCGGVKSLMLAYLSFYRDLADAKGKVLNSKTVASL